MENGPYVPRWMTTDRALVTEVRKWGCAADDRGRSIERGHMGQRLDFILA